jgi:hypothetical protein
MSLYKLSSWANGPVVSLCVARHLGICVRWLPDWLPEIYLTSLMFEQAKSVSVKLRRRLTNDSRVGSSSPVRPGAASEEIFHALLRARQMSGPLPGGTNPAVVTVRAQGLGIDLPPASQVAVGEPLDEVAGALQSGLPGYQSRSQGGRVTVDVAGCAA